MFLQNLPVIVLTCCLSLAITRLIILLAHRYGWVARPKQDRWHQKPTALYGGVAIVVAYIAGSSMMVPQIQGVAGPALAGLLIGGVTLFGVGLRDDVRALNPLVKLLGQVMAVMPFLVGVMITDSSPRVALSTPLLMLWMVGLTNAFNLLDNMDGLSAGTAVVVGGVLTFYCILAHLPGYALLSAVLIASCLGFLWFNFRPYGNAQIFMGDCGSMFLGYMLAGLTVLSVCPSASTPLAGALVPLFLMAVPLFDTCLVIMCRRREGRAISQGGKDHSSHRLVYAGFSEKQAVLLLHGLSLLFGATGLFISFFHNPVIAISLLVLGISGLIVLGNFLSGFTGAMPTVLPAARAEQRLDVLPS
ncbi:MAG: MraY family glycosyltransferase [Chloroherpetonaceae bacterium]|nr:undecaprenyl/decaprenyl-phosphate alpha-N-acetylglucosaminyl 1-phosphate transferase [Chthonomonadaceae bacterium]MDW8209079.1 MraY family glycosyltransferase [Chloroherpetonaceae bacterium]